jgi:hypothetical protein
MAICAYCGSSDPPTNTNHEHWFIPYMGCIVKVKSPPLPTCT